MTPDYTSIRESLSIDRMIPLHLSIVRSFDGHHELAALLGQIYYWSERTADSDRWFYKTQEEFWQEICLSPRQVRTLTVELISLGLIETKRYPIKGKGNPNFYRLTPEGIQWFLSALEGKASGYQRKSKLTKREVNVSLTSQNANFTEREVNETVDTRTLQNVMFMESDETALTTCREYTESTAETTACACAKETPRHFHEFAELTISDSRQYFYRFVAVWPDYLNKIAKPAWEVWLLMKPSAALAEEIIRGAGEHAAGKRFQENLLDNHGRFYPSLAKWLEQEIWKEPAIPWTQADELFSSAKGKKNNQVARNLSNKLDIGAPTAFDFFSREEHLG